MGRVTCTICHESVSRQADLARHVQKHTEEGMFECSFPDCDFKTRQKSNLHSHENRHTGKKPYVCSFGTCTYSTSHPSAFSRHRRIHAQRSCSSLATQKSTLSSRRTSPYTIYDRSSSSSLSLAHTEGRPPRDAQKTTGGTRKTLPHLIPDRFSSPSLSPVHDGESSFVAHRTELINQRTVNRAAHPAIMELTPPLTLSAGGLGASEPLIVRHPHPLVSDQGSVYAFVAASDHYVVEGGSMAYRNESTIQRVVNGATHPAALEWASPLTPSSRRLTVLETPVVQYPHLLVPNEGSVYTFVGATQPASQMITSNCASNNLNSSSRFDSDDFLHETASLYTSSIPSPASLCHSSTPASIFPSVDLYALDGSLTLSTLGVSPGQSEDQYTFANSAATPQARWAISADDSHYSIGHAISGHNLNHNSYVTEAAQFETQSTFPSPISLPSSESMGADLYSQPRPQPQMFDCWAIGVGQSYFNQSLPNQSHVYQGYQSNSYSAAGTSYDAHNRWNGTTYPPYP